MNKTKKILINGDFLCRNLTGVERFAYEICKRLDSLAQTGVFAIYVPANTPHIPEYHSIEIIRSRSRVSSFVIWTHFTFQKYVITHPVIPLTFSNVCPLVNPGYVFLHDIYSTIYPQDFASRRDKLICIYTRFMSRYIAKHAKKIFTVSEYSRKQIADTYRVNINRITVVPNGWDHFKTIKTDNTVFTRFFRLIPHEYFFTLGSLSTRKNLKWIAVYAQKHQNTVFAVSGKSISGLIPAELETLKTLPNVVLLSYVNDGEVKALMTNCKAFIFPSYYEGFGIPPLEALSCGVPVIVSNAASLPEIYGTCAHYISPDNPEVDLNIILKEPVDSPQLILDKYTYDKSALKLYRNLV
jgi:glycosyltransferase involved in cell wall biosynthesis